MVGKAQHSEEFLLVYPKFQAVKISNKIEISHSYSDSQHAFLIIEN